MAGKFSTNAIKRIVGLVLLPPISYVAAAHAYVDYKQRWGTKRRYPESQLYLEKNSSELQEICQRRQKLIESLRDLIEIVPESEDGKPDRVRVVDSSIFTDDVVWKDPLMTVLGKEDLTRVLTMLPKYIRECESATFDVVHYSDYVRISHVRNIHFATGSKCDRESSLTVKLKVETPNDEEKICELIDEWNSVPLVDRTNSTVFGLVSELMRIYFTKFELFKDSFRSEKHTSSDGAEDYSKYLEKPEPKYAGKR